MNSINDKVSDLETKMKDLDVRVETEKSCQYSTGCMDELGFYVPSTVFQSFRDDGRVNMKGSVQ